MKHLALVALMLLVACGGNDRGPAADEAELVAVGELDCADGSVADGTKWAQLGPTLPPWNPGLPSAEQAIRSALEPYRELYGGEVVLFVKDRGSLVVEQRERVIVIVFEARPGQWVVTTLISCEPII
ncbi:MAG: hypothetical protein V3U46_10535 [Acidimicrobiia bacterium]